MCRKEPWAHHALAHVMLTEGRLAEGLDFLQGVSDSWIGLNSFMLTHNWWHVALFLIDLGRDDDALAVYDQHVWGVEKGYSQDQIGAVSLLARLELAGIEVGEARWADVAQSGAHAETMCCPSWTCSTSTAWRAPGGRRPTPAAQHRALHAAIAVAGARGLGARLRAGGARPAGACARRLRDGRRGPGQALPRLVEIGGSHAQRDLFAQVHRDALARSGRAS